MIELTSGRFHYISVSERRRYAHYDVITLAVTTFANFALHMAALLNCFRVGTLRRQILSIAKPKGLAQVCKFYIILCTPCTPATYINIGLPEQAWVGFP